MTLVTAEDRWTWDVRPMVGGYSNRQFHRIDHSVRVPGTDREVSVKAILDQE